MDQRLPLAGLNVLLVEDEAFIAMAIMDELESAGALRVEHAFTLADADEALEAETFEVAILDLRLSDGNSSRLARDLTRQKTQIVFHSGHAEVNSLQAEFPEARICHKPCRRNEFVTVIQDLLDR